MRLEQPTNLHSLPKLVVVLGSNDIGSAIAVRLFQAGWPVVIARDPRIPVLRRRMAFDDAFAGGEARLDGIAGRPVEQLFGLFEASLKRQFIPLTELDLGELILIGVFGRIGAIIDARMHKYRLKPDIRRYADLTIGVGPGFNAGRDVHVAIETRPGMTGRPVYAGPTEAPSGKPDLLGGAGSERFVYAIGAGSFAPRADIGDKVEIGDIVGFVDATPIRAPLAGHVRGLIAGPRAVSAGAKLLEIDPSTPPKPWDGIAPRAAAIADCALGLMRGLTEAGIADPNGAARARRND